MHYYKRNIGDYSKKAGRLSMLQHGAYTLLMDACYDREQFPTMQDAIDWTWASSTAEIEAVEFVLRKFFTLDGDQYVQKRIQEEVDGYHKTSETNKRIAAEREAKRRGTLTDRERSVNGAKTDRHLTTNHEPLTTNQEPKTEKAPRVRAAALAKPDDVDDQTWTDWLALRKKKSAPVTQTVVNGAASEAAKAGMTLGDFLKIWCLRGSQGLQADWLKPEERRAASRRLPAQDDFGQIDYGTSGAL